VDKDDNINVLTGAYAVTFDIRNNNNDMGHGKDKNKFVTCLTTMQ